ncbi:glycosyltransferase [Arthrobacter sulfonylureivorans]|uniref:Rhamnosyl transferase n=1 Tax=Arthrobacter sulfonylureivorans TaxID=2486855 RepID=A0ABY3WAL7_9MICC|nr:glycosyltransferase [Arthrobacter sulfonylureivorans]UNK47350.1 putative rhamnosyl transferase [Arthrobacter sulfonylureivorans]
MLFIGHTRFSLFEPDSGAWRASNGTRFNTVDEYRDYLFSDERLAPRAEIFINESLPQLNAAIGDHDVLHVVSYSDSLPARYENALKNAAERYPFLVLDKHSGGKSSNPRTSVERDAVSQMRPAGGVYGRYRLDDDDLLPTSYFDQIAPYVSPEHVGWMVSLGSGFTGVRIGGGYYDLRRAYYPLLALGLLSVCKVSLSGKFITPLSAPHEQSAQTNPVILDGRGIGYFWGRHPLQDTTLGRSARTEAEVINRLRDSISAYPPITDVDDLKALFPAVWHKMHRTAGPTEDAANLLPEAADLVETPLRYSFDPVRGKLGMAVSLECSGSPTERNALVSFDLTDTTGGPVPEHLDADLLRAGIVRSTNPDIGYYRYLPTNEGSRTMRYVFELPEGLECRGASVRRFGKSSCQIRVTSLSFHEAADNAAGLRV